jgi:hypothetical protein
MTWFQPPFFGNDLSFWPVGVQMPGMFNTTPLVDLTQQPVLTDVGSATFTDVAAPTVTPDPALLTPEADIAAALNEPRAAV